MSLNKASSRVTYTSISSDYEEPSSVGPPGVIVYGYDGLPMHPVDPPSSDYMFGPKEPKQAPLLPDYPYVAVDSPVALSPGYIANSDPEEDPKDESEDGPTDYLVNGGDDDDDDDDSSGDDADDEDEEEASNEEEEEEEHLAPADSTAAASLVIPSLSFPVSSPLTTSPTYAEATLGFRAAGIRLRAASPLPSPTLPPTYHLLPSPPPSLPLLPPVDRREDILKVDILPRKRLCLTAPIPRFKVGETSAAAAARQPGLGLLALWFYRHGVNARVTEPAETHERDTQDLYAYLEDKMDSQASLSGRVDIFLKDHQQKIMMIEDEARDLHISSQEALTATLVAQVSSLQSQLIAALGQIQPL
ncbi:hypothetical protein Tco_1267438 [Tanacetum coccineum]